MLEQNLTHNEVSTPLTAKTVWMGYFMPVHACLKRTGMVSAKKIGGFVRKSGEGCEGGFRL